MKVGISTASLFQREHNEDAVALFSDWNIACAEVFLTTFCEYNEPFGKRIAERKGGVDVHSVHVLNTQFEPQLFSTEERVKSDAFQLLRGSMSAAKAFGAKYYTFHGIGRYKKAAREGKTDDYPFWAERLREIDEVCGGYGVKLSLETVEWSILRAPYIFSEIVKDYPNITGVLDIKQTRISGYPDEEYIKAMQGKITHVHLSDIDENGKMCLPGRGKYDFATLIKRLSDVGFDGALIIEAYKGDYEKEEELKDSYLFLREQVDKYAK